MFKTYSTLCFCLSFLVCDLACEESLFNTLFAELKNYVNVNAQETIQNIIDVTKSGESMPCDLQCQKKGVIFGIREVTILRTQVSGDVRELLSEFIALDQQSLKQFQEVSPCNEDGINAIGCKILFNKNQLMQEFYRSHCLRY